MPYPAIPATAAPAALHWWSERLNDLFGWLSNPSVFQNKDGSYNADGHLEYQLSVEQVFRAVAFINRSWGDSAARRSGMFTALDTFDGRFTGRPIMTAVRHSHTLRILDKLKKEIPPEAQPILLSGAQRAVDALQALQQGFHIPSDQNTVTLYLPDGQTESVSRELAAAQYVDLLRNATHGFGTKPTSKDRDRSRALLIHHTGQIPDDLPSLAYLHLLDVLNSPQNVERFVRSRMMST